MDCEGTRSGSSRMVEEGLIKAYLTLSDGIGGLEQGVWSLWWEYAQSTGGLSGRSQMAGGERKEREQGC